MPTMTESEATARMERDKARAQLAKAEKEIERLRELLKYAIDAIASEYELRTTGHDR